MCTLPAKPGGCDRAVRYALKTARVSSRIGVFARPTFPLVAAGRASMDSADSRLARTCRLLTVARLR